MQKIGKSDPQYFKDLKKVAYQAGCCYSGGLPGAGCHRTIPLVIEDQPKT